MARGRKKENLTPEERLQAALVPESEQPYEVPKNWCWVRLGEFSTSQYGYTAKAIKNDAYPKMLRITDIQECGVNWSDVPNCEITQDYLEKYRLSDGDIVIARTGATTGKSFFLNDPCNSVFASYLIRLRVNKGAFPKYVFDFLQTDHYWKQISELSSGIAQPGVNATKLQSLCFPLPPLAEQQRIVDRIERLFAKLDEAKQKAQDALDSFETRKAAILHKAFTGELIGKPSTATTTLEEITTCIRIGPFGSALHKEDYILGGIPVVNPKHIIHQKIVPEEKITVSVQKAEELSSYILQENDIILGRRGDMGRSAPVTDLETGWLCGTGSMIIRLKSGYNAKFYSQIIASQAAVRYLEENSVGSTMKNLNEKIVRLLPIPDFTVDEQLKIVRILDNLLVKEQQAKEAAEKVLEQIDLIKKSILARAFRGELGTNAPSEESAVELLRQVLSTSDM